MLQEDRSDEDGVGGPEARPKDPARPIFDPRNGVLLVLAAIMGIGGGRRLYRGYRARRAVNLLAGDAPAPENVRAVTRFGRAGLMDLFRLLTAGKTEAVRHAAGEALAVLWRRDELVAEEEKAVVVRGFEVAWRARRRYPRSLCAPIRVGIDFGLPFLRSEGPGITLGDLAWSCRVKGARRASLESFTDWKSGQGYVDFELEP